MNYRRVVTPIFAALLVFAGSCHQKKTATGEFELRVDAGNEAAYKDREGRIWEPDREYHGSAVYGFVGYGGGIADRGWKERIQGARDPRIYETEHWGMSEFVAEVPDGRYTVVLHFAETWSGIENEGPRVFDVEIEGDEAIKDLDVMKEAGGMGRALVKQLVHIQVDDGRLNIAFTAKHQNPVINGIEIVKE